MNNLFFSKVGFYKGSEIVIFGTEAIPVVATEITSDTSLTVTAQGIYAVNGIGEIILTLDDLPEGIEIKIANIMDNAPFGSPPNFVHLMISVSENLYFSTGWKDLYLTAQGDSVILCRQASNVIFVY